MTEQSEQWEHRTAHDTVRASEAHLAANITDSERAEKALRIVEKRTRGQKEAFQAAINGAALKDSLGILARIVTEEMGGEARTAFYIADPDGTRLHPIQGAGNMPESYTEQVDGFVIGEDSLACGLATATGRPVLTRDVFEEPLWGPWTHLARKYAFRGCWSFPIETRDGRPVGTFALYFTTAREVGPQDLALADVITQAAAIIMSRHVEARERARAEEALRASEQRFRGLVEGFAQAVWETDAAGVVTTDSPSWRAYTGQTLDQWLGYGWVNAIHPDDRERAERQWREAVAARRNVDAEFRVRHAGSNIYRWTNVRAVPLIGADGEVEKWVGMNIDIERRKRAEEHEANLSAELRHRVRNIIAIISTITARTAQSTQTVEEYADVLSGRLMALARTQALLTRAANRAVDVATIVRDEISAHGQSDGEYAINGPEVSIAPKAAEVVRLAIHELATNALKYGALSQPGGRVSVSWRVMPRDGERWLIFQWSENPAHPMKQVEPVRRGFGTELIERRIPYELHGAGQLTIDARGAQCAIEFPLRPGASVLETDAPAATEETHR